MITLRRVAAAAWQWLADLETRDLFMLAGLGAVWYGVAQFSPPAAWVICGGAVFWLGVSR